MSEAERGKWDEKYATGDYRPQVEPSSFLVEALETVAPGRALVLGCGTGRNALYLAEAGFQVEAIDISSVAIETARAEAERRRLEVEWTVADLDVVDLPAATFRLVTMIRYINRSLWPRAVAALAAGGWLLAEQHLRTYRPVAGPQDDEFRVTPGELLQAFPDLRTIRYSERLEPSPDGERRFAFARFLGCKGDPGW